MINMFKSQRIFYWSCVLFLCFSTSLSAQTAEICGNGLDDDGDGLVDCYDPDCCGDAACATTFYDPCDIVATCFEPTAPTTFSIVNDRTSNVLDAPIIESSIPFVGDLDNDGVTDYVAVDQDGPAYIFRDGAGGLTLTHTLHGGTLTNGLALNAPNPLPAITGIETDPYPAIGDLDNDGVAEVIVRQPFAVGNANHYHLCVYSGATGDLLAFYDLDAGNSPFTYINTGSVNNRSGTTGIYDFDGDGTSEISHGLGIFRYNPAAATGSRLNLLAYPTVIEGRGINNNYYGEQVVAVDIDPNTVAYGLELIAGNTVYDVDPTTATPNNGGILGTDWTITIRNIANTMTANDRLYPDGYTSIVDWDDDNLLDVVVTSNINNSAFIYVWNPRTEVILAESNGINSSTDTYLNRMISRASVTDFDNDGELEIAVTTSLNFRVFELSSIVKANGIPLLTTTAQANFTTTDQSGSTTCTAFDFNYDGSKEIVYRDESALRIFNYDGAILTEVATSPCFSGTVIEYPIVADVDNDGQAEIVCACKPTDGSDPNAAVVTVFESGDFPWADTRSVWNQHAYFYANINDDLSVPRNQQNHALPDNGAFFTYPGQINSFLHQHADTVFRLPNAVLSNVVWDCYSNSITVEICNEGDNTLPAAMPITIYAGNPETISPIVITDAVLGSNISPDGSCVNVSIPLTGFNISSPTVIYVMLNADANTSTPFDLTNYTGPDAPNAPILECYYTDNIGNLTIHPNPTIGINASVTSPVCQSSPVTLTATSSNNSISSLVWDPVTLGTTNPVTVIPTTVGTQTYGVTVTDNNGCSGVASIEIEVEECCPIKDDPSYFHLTANTDAALLAQYKIIATPPALSVGGVTRYFMRGADGYHSLPSRVYIDDGIVLEVRGQGAVLDLVNSDVVFGECARLEVLNGGELRAYNTVFRPCNESTSWGGVVFTITGGETTPLPIGNIRECTFINADVGLHLGAFAEGGYTGRTVLDGNSISEITIQDNLFSNCRRGIRIHNLAPNQAISGNDFQIDNVDNITFHQYGVGCTPIVDNNDYIGIEFTSEQTAQAVNNLFELNIHQNTFVDATPILTSQSEYTGIQSLEGVTRVEISANDFTNMFQSIRLHVIPFFGNYPMMIESNEINVTRRSALNNIGSSQIVITNGINIEIFNNKLSCSADPLRLDPTDTDAAFMQSAINIDNASSTIVRDNVIEGFEVGIYVHQTGDSGERLIKVADNKIKSNYYGIFLDSELIPATTTANSRNAYIQCNEIEMDLENHTTSVGVAAYFNSGSEGSNHFISGNCIKHSYRAIEIVNATNSAVRMPTVLNNYLYNYLEAGISIDGEFNRHGPGNPTIGQRNSTLAAGSNGFGGHNTFISNNEENAFDIFVTAGSTTVEAINNDYGTTGTAVIDNTLTNVILNQGSDIQYPSFAKCANQDASLTQDALNNLGSAFNLYSCGSDAMFEPFNPIFRTNTSGSTVLTNNYTQAIQEVVADDNGRLLYGLTVDAFGHLSSQADKDALYAAVVNTGVLTTNEAAWLSYRYESNQGNYATAKQVVQSIQGETEDENELKAISIINMDLSISSRRIQELTDNEIQILKTIDDRRGVYAVDARNMVDAAIGGHSYLFAPYPLSKPLNSKSISRLDFTVANLTLYPNPTNSAINIDFVVTEGSNQVLNIYNATGKLIKSVSTKAMVGKLTVDVADLAQGMYIATLKSENGNVQSGKFVKQ